MGAGRRGHLPHIHTTSQQPSGRASSPALSPLSQHASIPATNSSTPMPPHSRQMTILVLPHSCPWVWFTYTLTSRASSTVLLGEAQGPLSQVLLHNEKWGWPALQSTAASEGQSEFWTSTCSPAASRSRDVLMFPSGHMSHSTNTDPFHCVAMDPDMALSDRLGWELTMAPAVRASHSGQLHRSTLSLQLHVFRTLRPLHVSFSSI